ncbi:MAG: hypothetical protein LUD72_06950 [Bacteroidales bacterium]|nr:hypothetical protein [Bacteroidales bacterium]
MSKRIIIIENCEDCENCVRGFLTRKHVCLEQIGKPRDCPDNGTPDWCPLPKIPERRNTVNTFGLRREAEENHVSPQHQAGFNLGWNAALDAILKETKEE